jgi:hypothetical protein
LTAVFGVRDAASRLVAGLLLAVSVSWPYALHLQDALPGGTLDGARGVASWLPWQLYVNAVARRGLDDASVFVFGGDAGLHALVGNPGVAALIAPLHALNRPILAHNLALLLLLGTGAAAMGLMAKARGGGLASEAACMLFGLGPWWWAQAVEGAPSTAWLAPGALASASFIAGHRRVAWACTAVGAVTAPALTAALLVTRPHAAGLALAGLLGPPLGHALAAHLPAGGLAWPAAPVGTMGLSLAFILGLPGLGRRGAAVAGLALLCVDLPTVGGFALPSFALPHPRAWLGAACVLSALPWIRLHPRTALLLLTLEPFGARVLHFRSAPWTGDAWPVPKLFEAMARAPFSSPILQLPLLTTRDGAAGFIPLHRQRVSGGPGMAGRGHIRAAIESAVLTDAALGALLNIESGDNVPAPLTDLRARVVGGGWRWVVLYGNDAGRRLMVQSQLGPPSYEDTTLVAWEVAGQRQGGGPGIPGR